MLHYGEDGTHRSAILRTAGYNVVEVESISELARWFRTGGLADLVCITESQTRASEGPLAVVKKYSQAPVVIFSSKEHHYLQRSWDLEVNSLTHPTAWLGDIAQLLGRF